MAAGASARAVGALRSTDVGPRGALTDVGAQPARSAGVDRRRGFGRGIGSVLAPSATPVGGGALALVRRGLVGRHLAYPEWFEGLVNAIHEMFVVEVTLVFR
jgi:hypothetical protein